MFNPTHNHSGAMPIVQPIGQPTYVQPVQTHVHGGAMPIVQPVSRTGLITEIYHTLVWHLHFVARADRQKYAHAK